MGDDNESETYHNEEAEKVEHIAPQVSPSERVETSQNNNDEVIKNLLTKIEELSTHIYNSQLQFENQINECKKSIEIEKQRAFEEGYKKGVEDAKINYEKEFEEKRKVFEESILRIDKINEIFEEKILSIEKELISVALDIAREVIQKEISKNSQEVAYNLAKSLMEEIKEATTIKLKVNPKDAEYLKDKFTNVEIIPDSAIKEGGVVLISDLGNIDAEVMERFKNIKEAILEGKE